MSAYTDEQRALAWDEGYTAGREDADWEDEQGGIRLPRNPYRPVPSPSLAVAIEEETT